MVDLKQNSKPFRPRGFSEQFQTDIKLFYRPSKFLRPIQTNQFLGLEKFEPRTSLTKKWRLDQLKKNKGIRRFTRDNLETKLKLILDEPFRRGNWTLFKSHGSANILKNLTFNRLKFMGSYSTLLEETLPKTTLKDLSFTQLSPTLTLIKLKDKSPSRIIPKIKHLNKEIPRCLDQELFVTTLKKILKKSFKENHWDLLKREDSGKTLESPFNASFTEGASPRKLSISGVRIKRRLKKLKGLHIRGYSYYNDKVYGFGKVKLPLVSFDLKEVEKKLYNETEFKLKSIKAWPNSALWKRPARFVINSPFGLKQPSVKSFQGLTLKLLPKAKPVSVDTTNVGVKPGQPKDCSRPDKKFELVPKGLFLSTYNARGLNNIYSKEIIGNGRGK